MIEMANKQKVIDFINKMIEDEEIQTTENVLEAIFYSEQTGYIFGDFDCGIRGLDHNVLISKDDGIEWQDVVAAGIIIVPETKTYISKIDHEDLEEVGYKRVFN